MFEDDDYIECGCEPDRFGYVGHQCPNCGTTIKRSEEPLEAHSEPDPEPDKPHPGHCPKCGQTWLLPEALGPGRARLQCSRAYCLSDNWLMDIEAVSTVPQVVAPWGRETVWVSDPALDNLELLSVTEARGRLVELLDSFPFVEDADRVHSTALLLQTFFRASIPGNTPIYLIGSQETGAGKSLLADTCLAPAFGFEMVEATALGGYRSTQARALIAALNKNPQAVKLDNVQYSLDLEELAQAVSGQRVAGVHLPAAPTWVMTAIRPKLKLGDQIAARCVFINLEDTEWTHDLAPIEELDRRRYAEAATSILRAWLDQGGKPSWGTLRRFERWSAVMQEVLDVAGLAEGFLENSGAVASRNGARRGLYRAWRAAYGNDEVTARRIFEDETLRPQLETGKGWSNPQAVGMYLKHQLKAEPEQDGFRLEQLPRSRWRVISLG